MQQRDSGGLERTTAAVGLAGVCWVIFGLLNTFHVHGWKSFGLALLLTFLVVAGGRLAVRRIKVMTDLERRVGSGSRTGTRAERRERQRRRK